METGEKSLLTQRQHNNDEPLKTEHRKVKKNGGSLYGNLTDFGANDVLNVTKGDEVRVDVYSTHITISRSTNEEDDDE